MRTWKASPQNPLPAILKCPKVLILDSQKLLKKPVKKQR